MEVASDQPVNNTSLTSNNDFLQISCNWKISNSKQFGDAFTTVASDQEYRKTNIEEIVSFNTCISLQPILSNNEPCKLDIKLRNHQRICYIGVVSEASVLEFYKQFGEYERTVFAELVDEFEDNSVFIAETAIVPPTTEASIKFVKTKKKTPVLWIYGIVLYVSGPINKPNNVPIDIYSLEMHQFLTKLNFHKEKSVTTGSTELNNKSVLNFIRNKCTEETRKKDIAQPTNENGVQNVNEMMTYIDNKFHMMETRIMHRIDELQEQTNEKLDLILKQLETQFSIK